MAGKVKKETGFRFIVSPGSTAAPTTLEFVFSAFCCCEVLDVVQDEVVCACGYGGDVLFLVRVWLGKEI